VSFEFKPTHQHAEGDLYMVVAVCKVLDPQRRSWARGMIYRNEKGEWFVRPDDSFNLRFTPLGEHDTG
jgi:hypothetical protein